MTGGLTLLLTETSSALAAATHDNDESISSGTIICCPARSGSPKRELRECGLPLPGSPKRELRNTFPGSKKRGFPQLALRASGHDQIPGSPKREPREYASGSKKQFPPQAVAADSTAALDRM